MEENTNQVIINTDTTIETSTPANPTTPATHKKSKRRVLKTIAIVIAAIMLIFSTVCSAAICLVFMGDYIGFSLPSIHIFTKEDDVTIGGQYEIKSTTQISAAYHSGDTSSLSDDDKETLEMATKVLNEVITKDMTPVESERAVYDWMCKNIKIDGDTLNLVNENESIVDNPHGVLKTHQAVCVGYATTFRLFMEMLDIPCKVIHDDSKSHSWDLVQFDDDWYHVDIYSAATGDRDYYFNVSDDIIRGGSMDWDTSYFPAATSLKYFAPFQNKVKVKDVLSVPAEIRKLMDGKSKSDSNSICLEFETEQDDESMDIATMMVNSVNNNQYGNNYFNYAWFSEDDVQYLMISYITGKSGEYNENENTDSDDLYAAGNKALREAFKDLYEDISIY